MSRVHVSASGLLRPAPARAVARVDGFDRAGETRALLASVAVAALLVAAGFALRVLASGLV